jgi:hypothetical protein
VMVNLLMGTVVVRSTLPVMSTASAV